MFHVVLFCDHPKLGDIDQKSVSGLIGEIDWGFPQIRVTVPRRVQFFQPRA